MQIFKKFTLKNFRGFVGDEQNIMFGVPDNKNVGSGLTFIVGANNSGKTTVLEAMSFKEGQHIRSSEKNLSGEPEFTLFDQADNIIRKINLIRPESSVLQGRPSLPENQSFEIISSRRHWESGASGGGAQIPELLNQAGNKYTRRNENANTSYILKNIEKDDTKYIAFIELVKHVVPEFTKFTVGYEETEYIEYISGNGVRHRSDFLGDGVISIIKIIAHLFENTGKPLIIDEPELSLHPLAQKKLAIVLGEFSKTRQIIISTHSPYFVEWEFIKNGATLNRVVKEDDKTCKIYILKPYATYKALLDGANWQQPYLIDTVAKEIFFQEDILFLEGQEDVGLLRKEFKGTSINIFGYGVRGYNGFEVALQLAEDIGIKKAAIILDSPTATAIANPPNENTIKAHLEARFPNFKIIQWNKEDIRDKPATITTEKSGYFTAKGKLKDEGQLDDYYDKIKTLHEYFSRNV